ncbi:ABC transporter ATPase, partial [Klebsiella pneumoniae]|nr:ABC transporter ATPase [Klebsiella pneumoniae]
INDGGIELLVDPAKLRKVLSDNQYSGGRLNKLLLELKAATVEIVTPKLDQIGERIIGGLIDHVIPSPMTRNNPLPDSQGGVRRLW